jgi:hypothetical protein
MVAVSHFNILICSQDQNISSHIALILRDQLNCHVDECLHHSFFRLIVKNRPSYDVMIFIKEKILVTHLKNKLELDGINHIVEIENSSQVNDQIEELLNKIKIKNGDKTLPKKITNQNDILYASFAQSDTANELFYNFDKTSKKRYSKINEKISHEYRIYIVQALKICELNPTILKKIESNFDLSSYNLSHSYLIALTSLRLLNLFNLLTPLNAVYMALTSLLHDLEFSLDKNLKTETEVITKLENGKFDHDPQASKIILYHGENAAKLIAGLGDTPLWVKQALTKHHERPKGKGFPIGEDIQSFEVESLIFIVSHIITDQIDMTYPENLNMNHILKKINFADFETTSLRNNLPLIQKLDIII